MARGNIRKRTRKDGTTAYMVRVEMPPHPRTGKRKARVGTFDTEKAAEKTLTAWLADLDKGVTVEPTKMTMTELLRRWLDDEAAARVRSTTLAGYRLTVETHIIPALGNVPAQRLTVADVQRFRSEMVKTGKVRTAQVALLRLKQALAWAVAADLLSRNVSASVKRPNAKAPERKTWSADEARRFLKAAESDGYSPLWLLLLTTGLRRGEALGLRLQDLDLDRGLLTVRQTVVACKGAAIVQEPKSKAASRTVRLPAETVAALRAHRKRQAERQLAAETWVDGDLVFSTRTGKPINPRHVLRSFAAIVNRAGVPRISIHDLRHTHATLLLRDGVPVKVVSERLGHAQASITLDVYAHVMSDMQEQAVDSIGAALFKEKLA
jgi:integrase